MANGIGRLRTMGIAAQPTFGTPAPTATFVIPLLNAPVVNPIINKVMNNASLGSAYQINDVENTTRLTESPMEFKIDENQFPLFLKQRYSIVSTTVSGETVAYTHQLTFQNSTQTWYTLFLQDDNLQDYIVSNALFGATTLTMDQDFLRASVTVVGNYPSQSSVTNVITEPKEFVGRMVMFEEGSVPTTTATTTVLAMTGNLEFGLNSDETRFGLGSADLAVLALTSDKYMFNISRLKSDVSKYKENENNTMKQIVITAESEDRFVSPTSTRPSITLSVPRAKIETYTEEPDLEELTKENYDLTALDVPGVSGAPMSVTVVNSIASY